MTTSLWTLTSPRIPVDPFSPDDGTEILVVGAGITGLMTALLLARAGRAVTVVEARHVGAVTTGNTTGKLSLLQGTVLSEIREHAGDDALVAYAEGNRQGQAWLLQELEQKNVAMDRREAWSYASSPRGRQSLETELAAALAAGIPARLVDETPLPVTTTGALRLAQQAQVHPMQMLAVLAAELRERGGRIVEGCRVRGVETTGDRLRVETSLGTVSAQCCVLATGVPILDRGAFFARLEPSRSFAAAYEIPSEAMPVGMFLAVDSPTRSLRTAPDPDGSELLVVGGGGAVPGRRRDLRGELAELDEWTVRTFGTAKRQCWWAAQDYRSHSRLPFAGRLPGDDRLFAATGYNKWGMTNGAAAALAISAEILGTPLEWARTLRAHTPGGAEVMDTVAANAAVAGHLLSGWAGAELRAAPAPDGVAEGEGVVGREGIAPVATSRVEGRVCRVSAICTHAGGVLNWNPAERSWDCPLHGSRFSPGGEVLEGPATRDLDRR